MVGLTFRSFYWLNRFGESMRTVPFERYVAYHIPVGIRPGRLYSYDHLALRPTSIKHSPLRQHQSLHIVNEKSSRPSPAAPVNNVAVLLVYVA